MDNEKEIQVWKSESETLFSNIRKMEVSNDLTYRDASSIAITIQDKIKMAEAFFKPMVDSAFQAHKTVCDRRNQVLDPLKQAKEFIKGLMSSYDLEQRKKREEAERKARAEAEEKERKKKAELEVKAKEAEAKGNTEKAEALRDKAENLFVEPKSVAAQAEKPQGISNRVTFDVVILDPKLVPEEYKIVDVAALKKVALATKGKITVPGVKFVEKIEVVVRSNGRKDY